MKDLYTFDLDLPSAIETYRRVGEAYVQFFSNLNIPFLVAEASCGDMGGSMSHEYHMPSHLGEDVIINCRKCGYSANEEVAETAISPGSTPVSGTSVAVWRGVSKDRSVLVNAWYMSSDKMTSPISIHAVKASVPDIDTSIEDATPIWVETLSGGAWENSPPSPLKLVNLIDFRVADLVDAIRRGHGPVPTMFPPGTFSTCDIPQSFVEKSSLGGPLNLVRIQNGDPCPRCETGTVEVVKSLELGHTFHLGTRYSDPMAARVAVPSTQRDTSAVDSRSMQMGCFGVGVTRIIGAIAEGFSDEKGLVWPLRIAPYQVIIVPDSDLLEAAEQVYDSITDMRPVVSTGGPVDALLDDRSESMPWKLKDADLTGYPVVIVLGRAWRESGACEVQCRRLSVREIVAREELPQYIHDLLNRLG